MTRWLAGVALVLIACAEPPGLPPPSDREYRGQPVRDIPFKTPEGATVSLPATDDGFLPVENERYKIDVAGLVANYPEAGEPDPTPRLGWLFGFTAKSDLPVESVLVEHITPQQAIAVVRDSAPLLKERSWSHETGRVAITRETIPWLYAPGPVLFVFRFTIRTRGVAAADVLHQAALFSEAEKRVMQR